ncbi:MAG TPA: hypothetical protein VL326_38830 [Kofleriaceae bacterium]|jgi:hypothetical protein|nr:hypothetical protein [Kofleriaceae bacterium]
MRATLLVLAVAACTRQPQSDKVVDNRPAVALTPPVAPPSSGSALLAWPVAPFTKDQLSEVKRCDLADTVVAKNSMCEHAAAAEACAKLLKDDEEPSKQCVAEYSAAVKANPAFAFAADLPGAFFGRVAIVDVPPAATKPLVAATIHYNWSGMGDGVDWTLTVKDANKSPSVAVTGVKAKQAPADFATKLAAMGAAVQNMLPVPGPIEAVNCFDNYPDWTATLEYDGGGKLELATHKSNVLGLGGPWQLTVGGVTYLQLGPQMVRAMADIMKALDLPAGEPMAMTCSGFDLEAAVLK